MLHAHVLGALCHNRAGSARNDAELIPFQAHLPDFQAVFDVENLHGFALIRKVNLSVGQHAVHVKNHQLYASQNALQIASHASKVKPSAVGRNAKSFRRNNAEGSALVREERFLKTSIVHGRSKGKFSCEKAFGLRNRFVDGRNVFRQMLQVGTRINKCFRGSCNRAVETRQLVTCVRQIFKDTVEKFRRRNIMLTVFIFHKRVLSLRRHAVALSRY